jgi:ATP-binding cassette, subfamily B, bacterial
MQIFPFYKQLDSVDCGPTCLRIIAKHHGKTYSLQKFREKAFITRDGVSLRGISYAAEKIGFRSMAVSTTFERLRKEIPLPCIAHWNQNHFIVIYKFSRKGVHVADPAYGKVKYSEQEFLKRWSNNSDQRGVCLLLEPTLEFYNGEESTGEYRYKLRSLYQYIKPYKRFAFQLLLGTFVGSLLLLSLPFLTQSIVDVGILNQNLNFIYLILIAQFVLFAGRISIDFIRDWILLHIGTRINISLISDFLIKLMKLPLRFYENKTVGDILQRIGDHQRIESFLTSSLLSIIFSIVHLFIFSVVLLIYNTHIFLVFLLGSIMYFLWIILFMKKRRELDFKRFTQYSDNQSNLINIINGMHEIKLNNCETQKRWEWEKIQTRLFKVNIKGLALGQIQEAGSTFINEAKNLIITLFVATSVITGNMTLGMMLAVQFIIGQLNSPVRQMIDFIRSMQDSKISLERLGEIYQVEDEEPDGKEKVAIFPEDHTITVSNLSFQYGGPYSETVLDNLNFTIPEKKVTAIVGESGSGKTTLIKLLLNFYEPTKGEIRVGEIKLGNYLLSMWRDRCGAVLQDGTIFSDTIARNISVGENEIDKERFLGATKAANLHNFIYALPLGYNTKIGESGLNLSQGQKQRILIARAIYKDPEYFFFDEATNALDANNEKIIMENLLRLFQEKTVVIVAHRLSTVKNADQIVVLKNGKIVEVGSHNELTKLKGYYYELVKNQLELGENDFG